MQSPLFLARLLRRASRAAAAAFALAVFAAFAVPLAHADSTPLTAGIASSPPVARLKVAAKEAQAQGLDVRTIEFSDWNTPNAAVANPDPDGHSCRHTPSLEDAANQRGHA
ncbi:methionine ABC transporter substrate-binding protein, partial [Burkholderia pseudomallei]|uniref:MetQ/NlpA family ABC transporter substrate-binding protein n=1 Tax=Burkholderia pseudomallei TaxID=28450 RepID=UPI000CCE227D